MAENDLSKIVGLIMENPDIIERIKALGEKSSSEEEQKAEEVSTINEPEPQSVPSAAFPSKSSKRSELLHALGSFLSEGRRKNLETMISIADAFDAMRTK